MAKQSNVTVEHILKMSKAERDALRKQLYLLVDKMTEEPAAFTSGSVGFKHSNGRANLIANGEVGELWVDFKCTVIGSKDPSVVAEQKQKRQAERQVLEEAGLRSPRA